MNTKDPKLIALLFNECINNQNKKEIANYMADSYVFIDTQNRIHKGKEENVKGWADFFDSYPDYRNNFQEVISNKKQVIMLGYSTCSHEALDGPAIWVAKVENDQIAEWRIFDDTKENRIKLKIEKREK